MIGFAAGVLVSLVAALPPFLLLWGSRGTELKQRMKLWAIGTALRFAIIGGGLYLLFTQTSIDRIPTVIGVAAAYFVLYVVEVKTHLRG